MLHRLPFPQNAKAYSMWYGLIFMRIWPRLYVANKWAYVLSRFCPPSSWPPIWIAYPFVYICAFRLCIHFMWTKMLPCKNVSYLQSLSVRFLLDPDDLTPYYLNDPHQAYCTTCCLKNALFSTQFHSGQARHGPSRRAQPGQCATYYFSFLPSAAFLKNFYSHFKIFYSNWIFAGGKEGEK